MDTLSDPRLTWLLRLRWVAVAGQLVSIAIAVLHYRAPLDLFGPLCTVAAAATSNAFVAHLRPHFESRAQAAIRVLLVLDTLLLTAMLKLAGGLHNPFTSFYLLHVTLATVLLPRRDATAISALCFLCVGLIYQYPGEHDAHWITMEMHFDGMMITLFATGLCILLFVGRLQAELKEREARLQEQAARLAHQRRAVGLATLAAGVAHELATPLSTIAVASHELRLTAERTCANSACLEDATLIRQEVDRCRAIIDRLISRGNGLRPVARRLSAEKLLADLGSYLPGPCAARVRAQVQEVAVTVDEASFLQALAALVKNGCDADPSGEAVEVSIRVESAGDGEPHLVCAVRDRGPGFPEEVRARLGDPFVSTKDPGRGMGLGLYLVQLFCFSLEGELCLGESRAGATEVSIRLPMRNLQ